MIVRADVDDEVFRLGRYFNRLAEVKYSGIALRSVGTRNPFCLPARMRPVLERRGAGQPAGENYARYPESASAHVKPYLGFCNLSPTLFKKRNWHGTCNETQQGRSPVVGEN